MIKKYSEIAIGIDLIIEVYKSFNPLIIQEYLEQDLDIHMTVFQIIEYLELHFNYTFEEPIKQYY